MFPVFFACPFVYKSSSLATSMAYDYYFLGLFADFLMLLLILLLIRFALRRLILSFQNKVIKYVYVLLKSVLIIDASFWILFSALTSDDTLRWSVNLDEEAKTWGVTCTGRFEFRKS